MMKDKWHQTDMKRQCDLLSQKGQAFIPSLKLETRDMLILHAQRFCPHS